MYFTHILDSQYANHSIGIPCALGRFQETRVFDESIEPGMAVD